MGFTGSTGSTGSMGFTGFTGSTGSTGSTISPPTIDSYTVASSIINIIFVDSNSTVIGYTPTYQVGYKLASSTDDYIIQNVSGSNTATISSLENGKLYKVAIRRIDALINNTTAWSNVIYASPNVDVDPNAPVGNSIADIIFAANNAVISGSTGATGFFGSTGSTGSTASTTATAVLAALAQQQADPANNTGVFTQVAAAAAPVTAAEFAAIMDKPLLVTSSSGFDKAFMAAPPVTAGVTGTGTIDLAQITTDGGAALVYAKNGTYNIVNGIIPNLGTITVADGVMTVVPTTGESSTIDFNQGGSIFIFGKTFTVIGVGSSYLKVVGTLAGGGLTATTTTLSFIIEQTNTAPTAGGNDIRGGSSGGSGVGGGGAVNVGTTVQPIYPAADTVTAWASTQLDSTSDTYRKSGSYNSTTGTVSFTNLVGGTKYYVDVQATGYTPITDSVMYTAPAVSAIPGDGTVKLLWRNFSSTNNTALSLTYAVAQGLNPQDADYNDITISTSSGYSSISPDYTGLANGTTYPFTLRVTDNYGNVYTSDIVSAIPGQADAALSALTIPTSATGNDIISLDLPSGKFRVGTGIYDDAALSNLVNSVDINTTGLSTNVTIPIIRSPGVMTRVTVAKMAAAAGVIQGAPVTLGVTYIAAPGNPTIKTYLANVFTIQATTGTGVGAYMWQRSVDGTTGTYNDIAVSSLVGDQQQLTVDTSVGAATGWIGYYRIKYTTNGTAAFTNAVRLIQLSPPSSASTTAVGGEGKIDITWPNSSESGVKYNIDVSKDNATVLSNVLVHIITGTSTSGNSTYTAAISAAGQYVVKIQTSKLLTPLIGYGTSDTTTVSNVNVAATTATAAICFLADAPVLTPAGYRPISSIKEGDLVRTAAGLTVAVKRVFRKEYEAGASVNPFVIPKGSFGALRALPISPNHEVMTAKGMMKAKDLGLPRMKMAGSFTYYNLELKDWVRDNLVVAGVECESLAPAARITMSKAEFGRFVKARYGPAAAARLKTVCFEEKDGSVSMPAL